MADPPRGRFWGHNGHAFAEVAGQISTRFRHTSARTFGARRSWRDDLFEADQDDGHSRRFCAIAARVNSNWHRATRAIADGRAATNGTDAMALPLAKANKMHVKVIASDY